MIHLKYKCKVNFVKLPSIFNLSVLKAGFRKYHRRPQHRLPLGCELCARQANTNPPHLPRIPRKCRDKLAEYVTPPAVRCGSHEGVYGN